MTYVEKAINDIAAINEKAKQAAEYCDTIIRQTSLQPIDGQIGGAAFYAPDDRSERQRQLISSAVRYMERATDILHNIAVAGGLAEAQQQEIRHADALAERWQR